MSAPGEAPKQSPLPAPESPTTARPLEMDDDDVQETGVIDTSHNTAGATPAADDVPPPKPPRPMSEAQKNMLMLKEAFPTIDEAVIKAVLTASRGQVEPAFNALLQMTDPEAVKDDDDDDQPPPQPPRPTQQQAPPSSTPMTQLEADEQYARQLAEHYENLSSYEARTSNRAPAHGYGQRRPQGTRAQQDYEREHSFIDDELPIIKENLRKGFLETQSKFNEWFTTVKKKIDGDVDDPDYHDDGPRHGRGGRRQGEPSRRSNDYDRYDADPQLLTDDFAGMKFHTDGTPARAQAHGQGQMGMEMGNPNVFRPPPKSTSPSGRKVAFAEQTEQIGDEIYDSGPAKPISKDAPAPGKASKWQPLSAVEPNPVVDNDPFSLGDSDDEKEAKDKAGAKADQGDLQKATAEAMADSLMDSSSKTGTDAKKT